MDEFKSDPNKNMRDDMRRGVSPEALADTGYEVPEHMLPEQQSDPANDQLEYRLDDPELDALWQKQRQRQQDNAPTVGHVTIAEAQRNAARYASQHREIRGEERRAARQSDTE